jgi:hypothetical protein
MKNYVIAIVIPLIIALLTWGATAIYRRVRIWRDGCKIQRWLVSTTCDEPGESHKSLLEISEGICLSKERVRVACLLSSRIFQSITNPGNYSIWRQEPQSIYEKRGLLIL